MMHLNVPDVVRLLTRPGTVLLDTIRQDEENRACLLFSEPRKMLVATHPGAVSAVLDELDAALREGLYVAGFLAFEAGYALEELRAGSTAGPLAWFGVYDAPTEVPARVLDELPDEALTVGPFQIEHNRAEYRERIDRVRHHIREGDVYQVNFTTLLRFGFDGSPFTLYRKLRRTQPVPYGAFINTGEAAILSLSPELFFRIEGEHIVTRPMKGTVARGRTEVEDRERSDWLTGDEKNRAENLMIVDLLRNDLSRVCEPGSVHVPALFSSEVHPTVIQMTSTVEGRLTPGVSVGGVLRALFPCGSITGAPKHRAMEIIRDLESRPRGVYCGAIGYADPDGKATFSVAIRTAVVRNRTGELGIGSGIVWDSDPETEYRECLLKARFLTTVQDFLLFETMRHERGIALLELHLDRLKRSAEFFLFDYQEAEIREALQGLLATIDAARVRVTLAADGTFDITTAALPEEAPRPWRLTVSDQTVDASDPFLHHKTTRRRLFDDEYERARQAGFDEVLFTNQRGELTEGSRTNLLVQSDGVFYTPPLSCGLLGGVYRRHLMQTRTDLQERVLHKDDLHRAEAIYVCNAVRGLVPAVVS